MQILIGCAKEMTAAPKTAVPYISTPHFEKEAENNAAMMQAYDANQLRKMLGVSPAIGAAVYRRYQTFFSKEVPLLAAIVAYSGIVYKNIDLDRFSADDFDFAQHHLWITSFLYGLLRPLDGIKPYRLEGNIELPGNGESMFAYWRPRLTDLFIGSITADDGILIDLASSEMRKLFDWNKVEKTVTVIKPGFYVEKNGKLTMPSVNAKKCRGAMTSWLILNKVSSSQELSSFTFNGLTYRGDAHPDSFRNPVFF